MNEPLETVAPTAPPPPTLADALDWNVEERGELPEQFRALPVDDLRVLVTERSETAAHAREEQVLARVQAEQVRQRQQQQGQSDAQQDIDYYQSLRTRLASDDESLADTARRELLQNEERYRKGASALNDQTRGTVQREVLRDFFDSMHNELERAGLTGVLPAVGDPGWIQMQAKLVEYDGKGGIAAYLIDQGRTLARSEFDVELQRQRHIDAGAAAGAPELGAANGAVRDNYSDPAWARDQMDKDPEWVFKLSPDGKLTNLQRVRGGAVPALKRS